MHLSKRAAVAAGALSLVIAGGVTVAVAQPSGDDVRTSDSAGPDESADEHGKSDDRG